MAVPKTTILQFLAQYISPHLPLHDEGHRQIWNVLHMDNEFLYKHKKLRHK